MDENTWRFAQVIMWLIGIQTAFLTAIIGFVWKNLNGRLDKIEKDVSHLKDDMIEVKTVLRLKECCMIQDERQLKKAE